MALSVVMMHSQCHMRFEKLAVGALALALQVIERDDAQARPG
jgi:hypothetical protein